MVLGRPEALAKARVVGERFEFAQLFEIRNPPVADRFGNQFASGGLAFKSQRRGVMPFVLLLNFDGQYSAKSRRTLVRKRSVCSWETPLTEEDPTMAR